jgi:hypothetical protein
LHTVGGAGEVTAVHPKFGTLLLSVIVVFMKREQISCTQNGGKKLELQVHTKINRLM